MCDWQREGDELQRDMKEPEELSVWKLSGLNPTRLRVRSPLSKRCTDGLWGSVSLLLLSPVSRVSTGFTGRCGGGAGLCDLNPSYTSTHGAVWTPLPSTFTVLHQNVCRIMLLTFIYLFSLLLVTFHYNVKYFVGVQQGFTETLKIGAKMKAEMIF